LGSEGRHGYGQGEQQVPGFHLETC
jgi:hypothetical protein